MTVLAQALSRSLIHFIWQGSVVGLLLSITLLPLRRQSAKARYVVSCLALAVLAILPVATTWFLYDQSIPAQNAGSALASPAAAPASPSAATQLPAPWLASLQSWALPVWSIGVVVFSLRLLWGYVHVWTLGRRGRRADEAIQQTVFRLASQMRIGRPIRVLISSMSDSPSVVGWVRPIILLPAATLIGLTPVQLEAILAHELAHIKRFDYLVNILQMLAETLLFYHPAVWWTSRRIRIERELCCDDLAVGSCGDAVSYARALSTLERLRLMAPSVVMSSTGGPLMYRIQRLVGGASHEYGPSRMPAIFAVTLGLLCLALNVNWIQGKPQTAVAKQELARAQNPIVRDAPGVTVDLAASSVIHRTPVGYPESARKQGVAGTVQIEVTLDSSGEVADAKVLSGPEELRRAALQSVLNWHFTSDAGRSTRLVNISFQPPAPGTEQTFVITDADGGTRSFAIEHAVQDNGEFVLQAERALKVAQAQLEAQRKNGEPDQVRQAEAITQMQIELVRRQAEASQAFVEAQARIQTDQASRAETEARMQELKLRMLDEQARQDDEKARASAATLAQRRALEAQMAEIKARMNADPSQRAELEANLRAVQAMLEATPFPRQNRLGALVGHAIKSISTPNLPASVRNELLARLPVREGDVLSEQTIEQTRAAVRNFDEHLEVGFVNTRADDQVEIRIMAPGR
jgi:TonB family protein